LWIPYAALPLGMALLALQCLAELLALATGRRSPFGPEPDAS
jgi:TRAP-type C4-dicarboxylate transport system permease small subunit